MGSISVRPAELHLPSANIVVVCQQCSVAAVMLSCRSEGVHSGSAPYLERWIGGQEQALARQLTGAMELARFHLPGSGVVKPRGNRLE